MGALATVPRALANRSTRRPHRLVRPTAAVAATQQDHDRPGGHAQDHQQGQDDYGTASHRTSIWTADKGVPPPLRCGPSRRWAGAVDGGLGDHRRYWSFGASAGQTIDVVTGVGRPRRG